jgi:K+-sensing histidine kinase KdpD
MVPQVIARTSIENALRYAPTNTRIELQAWADDTNIVVRVRGWRTRIGAGRV